MKCKSLFPGFVFQIENIQDGKHNIYLIHFGMKYSSACNLVNASLQYMTIYVTTFPVLVSNTYCNRW